MRSFSTRTSALLLTLILILPALVFAQNTTPLQDNAERFAPLDLPEPTDYRTADGRPGPAYWQQKADYNIAVTLNPATHQISGSVRITYTNNSPQPLHQLWLQLDQNAFADGSRSARLQNRDSRWRGSFSAGGYAISNLSVSRQGEVYEPDSFIDDTRLHISLHSALPSGGVLDIMMDYNYTIPEYGADRTGRVEVENGTVYQIAQWYPRVYVYDDVNGWNAMPYLGQGEFYTEYGNYDVEITTPSDFVVVATGELLNPDEVYTSDQLKRLAQARNSSETVTIISEKDVGREKSRPEGSPTLTWKFRAENVRDVAWGASQAFVLDAASWENVLVMSAYPRESIGTEEKPGWERSTEYVRHSIKHYSETWYRYPYPVAINVAGIVGGMEYPMIVFCSMHARDQALFGVTDHEFGHTWFPMIVGSDERRYAWMDEGFNTFINYFSNRAFYGDQSTRLRRYSPEYISGRMLEPIAEQPIMTYPDHIRQNALGFLAYRKPGYGLLLLREYILGPERFDTAFKSYINQWAYKHPKPADFFRTIEQVAGEDLSWFWRGWFYSTDALDQEITLARGPQENFTVSVKHNTDLLLPIEMQIVYADGSSTLQRVPVEAFFKQDYVVVATSEDTDIVEITIDPNLILPDIDRSNNTWAR